MFRFLSNRWFVALIAAVICIGLDQATKEWARQTLPGTGQHSYLFDTVRIGLAFNSGGFLSLGGQLSPAMRIGIFIVFNSVAMLALIAFLLVKRDAPWLAFLSLVLIVAGGIGNLIDRITNHGLVTDFINMGIGPLRTGIFNVADIAVTFGTLVVFVWLFRSGDERPPTANTNAETESKATSAGDP
jgi:signal peptidase II